MGFWKGTSEQNLNEAEKQLWGLTGLEEGKDYKIEKVKIDHPQFEDKKTTHKDAYVYTIILNDGKQEFEGTVPLVIVHGYGGSGMIFYQMFKDLASKYKVYLIDIYGMG